MRGKNGFTALLVTMILVIGLLAGCSSSSGNIGKGTSGDSSVSAGSNVEHEAKSDIIGEVSYVGSYYISVKAYTSATNIEDYALLDVSTLIESDANDSVNTDSNTKYYKAIKGSLVSIVREDISKGDMIVATTNEDGAYQIIILEKQAADTSDVDITEP